MQAALASKASAFPIFKTITLGKYKTPDVYRKAFTMARRHVKLVHADILGSVTCSQHEIEIDLVVASAGDLGLKHNPAYNDICTRAVEMGLQLCPAEVGAALPLVYYDQPGGETLYIAMEAVTDRFGGRVIFAIACKNYWVWLRCMGGEPNDRWPAHCSFVFVRPRA
jgi:hypothetical protein